MKRIIVSGASKGIGRELVIQFAKQGNQVLAISRKKNALEELTAQNDNIRYVATDLIKIQNKKEIVAILDSWSSVDVLINNAGQLINKSFLETTSKEFMQQYESNVISAINLSQLVYPYLKGGGHIVNISSMGGLQGSSKFPGLSAYSASKGAMNILAECMAVEFEKDNIHVNALCLGAVQTEMLEQAFPGFEAPLSAEEMSMFIMNFALNSGKYINGQVLPISLSNP